MPGGSLGPEAALLALCGSTTSYLARKVFGAKGQHLRNCALMGMTAGLAAFFGVALGGAPPSLKGTNHVVEGIYKKAFC